ncbi:MAG: phosphatase PAP2 family protein [Bacteroidetes bacterium]|nr:phosphatase PAP2 family protein [Bacteroidota bacterium]
MQESEKSWKAALSHTSFRNQFVITLIGILSFMFIFPSFFDWIESRTGKVLTDILLDQIPAMDVSFLIFFFLYSGIVVGVAAHYNHPKVILIAMQTYLLITLLRMASITLFPLNPPIGYIPLHEPFVQLFVKGSKIISHDLFFSGHVSTILSIYFSTRRRIINRYLLLCSIMISVLVLVQHVHYTIDVIAAVVLTYLVYKFCKRFLGGK